MIDQQENYYYLIYSEKYLPKSINRTNIGFTKTKEEALTYIKNLNSKRLFIKDVNLDEDINYERIKCINQKVSNQEETLLYFTIWNIMNSDNIPSNKELHLVKPFIDNYYNPQIYDEKEYYLYVDKDFKHRIINFYNDNPYSFLIISRSIEDRNRLIRLIIDRVSLFVDKTIEEYKNLFKENETYG